MNKKIVIVSSGQPFGNPRMVKEAITFVNQGATVYVIYSALNIDHIEFDEIIKSKNNNIIWINVGFRIETGLIKRYFVKFRRKFWIGFYRFFGNVFNAAIKSLVPFSQELTYYAYCQKADIYIGHNLGALFAVVNAAKRNKAKSSLDFEDYYRGESMHGELNWKRVVSIEDKLVPHLDFATCASPLIEAEYKKLYPSLKSITINNCFPLKYRNGNTNLMSSNKDVKLFWFSQFIGKERGIEDIIRAIGIVNDERLKISLLGNIESSLKSYFKRIASESKLKQNQLIFLDPVNESELVQVGQQHHIGLASEVLIQENRNYCLTNKIFIYLLSNNAILFSNTKAQNKFLNEHQGIGLIYRQGNIQEIAAILGFYLKNPLFLETQRKKSELLGNHLNWENESLGLLKFYNLD